MVLNPLLFNLFIPTLLLSYVGKWELYKQFFEESPVALTVVEENGLISYANKKFAELTGYELHEIIGEHFTKFVAPEDRQRMEEYHKRRIEGKEAPEEYEYKCLRKDGEIRYVRLKAIRLPENRTISCKIDITEEKKAKEMQVIFEKMAHTAMAALFICHDDHLVYVNPAMEKITGYNKDELLKMSFWELVREDYRKDIMEKVKERKAGQFYELPILSKDGKEKWLFCTFTNITYKDKPAVLGTAVDITERKRSEEEIKERERRFEFLYKNSPIFNVIIGFDGKIVDVNDYFLEATGYKKEEVVGKPAIDFVADYHRKKAWEQLQRDLKGEKTPPIEIDIIGKKKIHTVYFGEGSVIVHEKGKPIGVLISGVDITERKKMEEALRESEEKYKMLVELSQEGICIDDENERIVFANEAFAKALGYKKEELLGKNILDIVHKEDAEKLRKEIDKRRKGEASKYEIRLLTKDGNTKTFIVSAIPLYKNGKFIGSLSVNLDITERKKAEEKLAESEALYRAITEYSQSGIFILQDGKFKFANTKFLEYTGYTTDDIEKINYWEIIHEKDREKIINAVEAVMEGQEVNVPEFRYIKKDGTIRWAIGTGTAIEYKGKPAFLGVMTDITELKKLYEKERKFIEDTSHYFLNPLCIAKGYIELAKSRINGEEKIMLEKAEEAILRVEKVIKNIVSKGEIHE